MFDCSNYDWLVKILAETGTFYDSSDDNNLLIIEEILYITLQEKSITMTDLSLNNTALRVEKIALKKKNGFINYSTSASDNDLSESSDECTHYSLLWNRL